MTQTELKKTFWGRTIAISLVKINRNKQLLIFKHEEKYFEFAFLMWDCWGCYLSQSYLHVCKNFKKLWGRKKVNNQTFYLWYWSTHLALYYVCSIPPRWQLAHVRRFQLSLVHFSQAWSSPLSSSPALMVQLWLWCLTSSMISPVEANFPPGSLSSEQSWRLGCCRFRHHVFVWCCLPLVAQRSTTNNPVWRFVESLKPQVFLLREIRILALQDPRTTQIIVQVDRPRLSLKFV